MELLHCPGFSQLQHATWIKHTNLCNFIKNSPPECSLFPRNSTILNPCCWILVFVKIMGKNKWCFNMFQYLNTSHPKYVFKLFKVSPNLSHGKVHPTSPTIRLVQETAIRLALKEAFMRQTSLHGFGRILGAEVQILRWFSLLGAPDNGGVLQGFLAT